MSTVFSERPNLRSGGEPSFANARSEQVDFVLCLWPVVLRWDGVGMATVAVSGTGASHHYHLRVRGKGTRLCAEHQPQRLRGGVRVGIISPPLGTRACCGW